MIEFSRKVQQSHRGIMMTERIGGPAYKKGDIIWHLPSPATHMGIWLMYEKPSYDIPGFLTTSGRFVNRVEALAVAKACGQVPQYAKGTELITPMLRKPK